MGACFQAPHAAPGQRPMETFSCLTNFFFSFPHYSHHHMSLHMHKTSSTLVKCAWILCGWAVWSPLQYLPWVKERRRKKTNNNNDNNNKFWQQKMNNNKF